MPYRRTIAVTRLHEMLVYDSSSGDFYWRKNLKGHARAGELAGSANHAGYKRIRLDGSDVMLHRVAWAMTYGSWPALHIDHINGVRSDNRLVNLRQADHSLNMQNRRDAAACNPTGLLGVQEVEKSHKFRSKITIGGKQHYLGTFNTADEAHRAYLEAKRILHPGCTI